MTYFNSWGVCGIFLLQELAYLSEEVKGQMVEAPYSLELQQILASDRTNKEVNDWIMVNFLTPLFQLLHFRIHSPPPVRLIVLKLLLWNL